jgi:quercetin dioxygenase-like cupin family protein
VDKKIQPMLVHSTHDENIRTKLFHTGEEFLYILEGSMVFRVGDIEYRLHKGDSLYFNAMELHGITSVEDEVYYLNILSN